jgi:nucleotide-binding universal stress UspA family protein
VLSELEGGYGDEPHSDDAKEEELSVFPTTILLATDGSPQAETAARMAATLSEMTGSEMHVVYVEPLKGAYADTDPLPIGDPEYRARVLETAERGAREKLGEEATKVGGMGGVAGTHARTGRPDAEIVRLAEELGAGLLVLGSRGLGGVRRALMGSVSDSVVRHAPASVLVVRDGGHLPGRVLLALDGSEESEAATRAAVEISNSTGSELHLVFALPTVPRPPYAHSHMSESWVDVLESFKHSSRKFVDGEAQRIEGEGCRVKDAHLRFGEPDAEIVRLGEELEAALVVIGSRGLGAVGRALIGSTSDSVVRHAHCPVLVVRDKEARRPTATRSFKEWGSTLQ